MTSDLNDNQEIIEIPNNNPTSTDSTQLDYDYVVSEAAVGEIKGVHFTVADISFKEKEGKKQATTYLDIEKQRFEDIYDSSIVQLNSEVKVLILKIEASPEPQGKGKVYFKLIE